MKYFLSHMCSYIGDEPIYNPIVELVERSYHHLFPSDKEVDDFVENLKKAIASVNERFEDKPLRLSYGQAWGYSRMRIYVEDPFKANGFTLLDIFIEEVKGVYHISKKEAAV
jgi:hypothetical protein